MDLLAFKVVIEPDEHAWRSYYPAWEHLGAATCGDTQEEAAGNIKDVLEMMVEEIEAGEIEWPIDPDPDREYTRPSIQTEPEFIRLKCAPEFPDAIASHGGMPVDSNGTVVQEHHVYRLIYVAVNTGIEVMNWPEARAFRWEPEMRGPMAHNVVRVIPSLSAWGRGRELGVLQHSGFWDPYGWHLEQFPQRFPE